MSRYESRHVGSSGCTDSGMPAVEPRLQQQPRRVALPYWPERTVAVLGTYDGSPHAIPVASLLRAGDRRILFSLRRDRDSLARLRDSREIALTVLGDSDTAFTARGRARVLVESLVGQPEFAAVELLVEAIDDHRRLGYSVAILWSDERELEALRERISALQWLAASRGEAA
jgi:hypothetical protein